MVIVVQAGGIDEMGLFQAQLFGFFVHHRGKVLLAAADLFRQRDDRVVGAGDRRGLIQVFHRHNLAGFQENLRTAHRGSVRGSRHFGIPAQLAVMDRLHHQKQAHHFGHRRRIQLRGRILFIQNLSRFIIDQDRRFRRRR